MSKVKKIKKSTTKKKKPDTSKLIPIIAIVEVVVLIAVSTIAWFFFNANKTLSSGVITVNSDSGLEIDFKDADKSSYINIFDYIDENNFYFEPATSVDGRNIYFPTSGTFDTTDTENMVFRDGTVNDINSKYVDIDFELTNTSGQEMQVYLSHKSFFSIQDEETDVNVNGKALRLALYNNDGNSGNVYSNMIRNMERTSATETPTEPVQPATDSEGGLITYNESFTVYFNNYYNNSVWANDVKAYVWNDAASDHISSWPGDSMVNVSGNLYSYSFTNPYTIGAGGTKNYYYDSIIFNDGNGKQTVDINNLASSNNKIYSINGTNSDKYTVSFPDPLVLKTVYFLKPNDWTTPACLTSPSQITSVSGAHEMTMVTTGIYSYTFPSSDVNIRFIDNANTERKSNSTSVSENKLYYFPANGAEGSLSTIDYSTSSILFYNTLGWDQPYAIVNGMADTTGKYTYAIPMIALSGNLFYCNLCTAYLYDVVEKAGLDALKTNCKVFFANENNTTNPSKRTADTYLNGDTVYCMSKYVYTPDTSTNGSGHYYMKSGVDYSDEVDVNDESYAVISPGVSAGFQRPANPVNDIDYLTGSVNSIVPTFASSFDDFLIGSDNPVFTIGANETVNMSMIIWLEGTDTHCTADKYAANNIKLYLEFSTFWAGDKVDGTYTYHFIDDTQELWTSNTITNPETHVTVSPVMQLYDYDNDRGYLMSPKTYASYDGYKKVRVWECIAPQDLVNESGHRLQFRRVNPYDESEVWNRWEAGEGSLYKADSFSNATRTVSYTAFADGSPDRSMYRDFNGKHSLPQYSCGGLWGTYDTELLTVYDGRKDRLGGTDLLTFGYTYTYPNSGQEVTIEYRGSGYRNPSNKTYYDNFYSFVIPDNIFSCGEAAYFVDYSGFNSAYAINSDRNDDLDVATLWPSSKVGDIRGRFFEFNEEYDFSNSRNKDPNSNDYHSYWGSDVLYVQAPNSLSVSYSSVANQCLMQVKFYDASNHNFYSYLYDNGNYDGGHDYGFVAVVPAEGYGYTSYKIQRAHKDYHDTITREAELNNKIAATTETVGNNTLHINTIKPEDANNDGRIRYLEYDYKIIYYEASSWTGEWNHPTLISDLSDTEFHGGTDTGKDTSGKDIYYYHVQSNYKARFYWKDASEKYSVPITPSDGYCYYPKTYNVNDSGNVDVGGFCDSYLRDTLELKGNSDYLGWDSAKYNKYIDTSTWDNTSYPEYTPKQTKE